MDTIDINGFVLLLVAGVAGLVILVGVCILWKQHRSGSTSQSAIRRLREWQGQALTWSCYEELEQMIDEERAKGG